MALKGWEGASIVIRHKKTTSKVLNTGSEKYIKLGIPYRCNDIPEMDKKDCEKLYKKFMNIYKSEL